MLKRMKASFDRFSVLFLLTVISLTMVWGGISAPYTAYAMNGDLEFDTTDVLDDLTGAMVGGKPFNLLEYPFYTSAEPEMRLVSAVEYCYAYAANARGNYGLYLYVYNPNGQDIDSDSAANTVQMAVDYDAYPITSDSKPIKYEKFDLKFCSTVESGSYKHLVLQVQGSGS